MPLKSSRVSSRTSPSSSVRGGLLFGIELLLAPVGLAKTDDPKRIAANAEADDVKPSVHRRERQVSRLAVGSAVILDRVRRAPIQLRSQFERQIRALWRSSRSSPGQTQSSRIIVATKKTLVNPPRAARTRTPTLSRRRGARRSTARAPGLKPRSGQRGLRPRRRRRRPPARSSRDGPPAGNEPRPRA